MNRDTARMRRWLLLGAPAVATAAVAAHAGGGAAALGAWLLLGHLLPVPNPYPYPRKRSVRPHRMFWAWAVGFLALSGLIPASDKAFSLLGVPRFPSLPLAAAGSGLFSTLTAARAFSWRPGPVFSWIGGGVCSLLAFALPHILS